MSYPALSALLRSLREIEFCRKAHEIKSHTIQNKNGYLAIVRLKVFLMDTSENIRITRIVDILRHSLLNHCDLLLSSWTI